MEMDLPCVKLVATYPTKTKKGHSTILVDKNEFSIGRGIDNSYVLPFINVSRIHCILKYMEGKWSIKDVSTCGTFLNNKKLSKNILHEIKPNDVIKLGPVFTYIFTIEPDDITPPKKIKTENFNENNINIHNKGDGSECSKNMSDNVWKEIKKIKEQYESENASLQSQLDAKNQIQDEILSQKNKIENILQQERKAKQKLEENENMWKMKIDEMQEKLKEQEKKQEEIMKQLHEKEIQRLDEIQFMQEKQELEKQEIFNKIDQIKTKEQGIREMLESEINALKIEKDKLDLNIKNERDKQFGDSQENLDDLVKECEKIEKVLETSKTKKQFLEQELANVDLLNQETIENLQAKDDVLMNFEKLMENELQCSICSELFVKATTLNCSHTFCTYCIKEWRKKKNICPVCRTSIKTQNGSVVLDSFIDKMVENLTADMKNKRQEIVEERAAFELAQKSQPKKNTRSTCNTRQRSSTRVTRNSTTRIYSTRTRVQLQSPSTSAADVILITDDNSSSSSSSTHTTVTSSDSSESLLDWDVDVEVDDYDEMRGVPGAYYGGYGQCYHCGRPGHWANGCPQRYM